MNKILFLMIFIYEAMVIFKDELEKILNAFIVLSLINFKINLLYHICFVI